MNNPLISVIIPSYNYSHFLKDACNSIIKQTYTNWECIIIDDGSTDNTKEISEIICQNDHRFKYFRKQNGGLASARNAGLNQIKGQFIQFLDSDDIIHENKFSLQLDIFQQNKNIDICYSNFKYTNSDLSEIQEKPKHFRTRLLGNPLKDFTLNWVKKGLIIPIHSPLIKSSFIFENNISFNEKFKSVEDWLFWIQVSKNNAQFNYIDSNLALYRRHQKSLTQNSKKLDYYYLLALFEIYNELPDDLKENFSENYSDILSDELLALKSNINKIKYSRPYKLGVILLSPIILSRKLIRKCI